MLCPREIAKDSNSLTDSVWKKWLSMKCLFLMADNKLEMSGAWTSTRSTTEWVQVTTIIWAMKITKKLLRRVSELMELKILKKKCSSKQSGRVKDINEDISLIFLNL